HMPRYLKHRGREIDADRFLILHEEVEKTLIDQLDLHYLHAHQIATRAEQAAVRAAGISWRAYDRFMQENVKKIGDERLTKCPADLDLKPYRDEHDAELIARMAKGVEKGKLPKGVDAKQVQGGIGRMKAHLKSHETMGKKAATRRRRGRRSKRAQARPGGGRTSARSA